MISYSRQHITEADIAAVARVLRSDFLTQGPEVPLFEEAIASSCCAQHAIATSSATAALHVACQAMGLVPGDWLWTSPITFVASANCARYCGASVDFVDVDPSTHNMSVQALARKLASAEKSGRLPKIVVPVHLSGLPCDMQEIQSLADRYGFHVLEDASHALGATYHNNPIGSCLFSHAAVFSFHAVKMITTGEGGMALTNDPVLAEKMRRLRTHGITKNPLEMAGLPDGPWYYEQNELGSHYRLTELQAALGRSQMQRLDEFLSRRRALAERYDQLLDGFPLRRPTRLADRESSWHLYSVDIDFDGLLLSQKESYEKMHAQGIGVQLHYIPVHLQPDYAQFGFQRGDFPEAEAYYRRAMSLPLHCKLTDDEQDSVCDALRNTLVRPAR